MQNRRGGNAGPKDRPGSQCDPRQLCLSEAIAHIMVQKFVMASPLYRQEQELNRSGIQLSRQTMSNWILRASDDWLMPVYEEMHRRLVRKMCFTRMRQRSRY